MVGSIVPFSIHHDNVTDVTLTAVTGSLFASQGDIINVTVCGVVAAFQSLFADTVVIVSVPALPAGVCAVNIVSLTLGTTSVSLIVEADPVISYIYPPALPWCIDSYIDIAGTNLAPYVNDVTAVTLCGVALPVVLQTSVSVRVSVPAGLVAAHAGVSCALKLSRATWGDLTAPTNVTFIGARKRVYVCCTLPYV